MQIDWVDSPGRPATRRDLHQELLSARRCEAISLLLARLGHFRE